MVVDRQTELLYATIQSFHCSHGEIGWSCRIMYMMALDCNLSEDARQSRIIYIMACYYSNSQDSKLSTIIAFAFYLAYS